ncbi:MAG: glycosyltransferase family 4 protein [bacterium]
MPKGKALRISHLHWGFPPIIGGVETHLTILLPMLSSMGHKVNLLTGAFPGEKDFSLYSGVGIRRHPVMDLNWLSRRGVNGLEEEVTGVFKKFIDETKPDCLHVHNMHYFSKVHAEMLQKLAKKYGIALILTAHNVWDDNLFLDLAKQIGWAHIIAVSHFIKQEIVGIGYNHKKITVIHHGIDQDVFTPNVDARPVFRKYPILKGKKVIFHPARMGLAKGCDVSIKALRIIKEKFPEVVLVLAGTKNIIDWIDSQQKDIAYMMRLIESLGLKNDVLVDSFSLEEMPGLYAASMICMYPSTASEPFGLTMLESLASARPMIVTKTGGMPEIIKDGVNGFVIPVKDFGALASKLMQILESDDLRKRLGETGRQMVEQKYSKQALAENTLNLYRKFV